MTIFAIAIHDGLDVRVSVFNYLAARVCKFCACSFRKISHLFARSVGPMICTETVHG